MGTLFVSLVVLIGASALAWFSVPFIVWTAAIAITLITFQFSGLIAWSGLLLWPLFLGISIPILMPQFRQEWFTKNAFAFFRRVLPAMSDTEREAIESGNVWWEAKLFSGKPEWRQWLALERPKLTQEELDFIEHKVTPLIAMLNDWHILHENHDLPEEVWAYLKKERFFGMIIPKRYGGLEFSALAHSTIIARIATRSLSAAVNTMVPNSIGPAELLLKYGTQKQQDYYLPRLADGTEIPCFALTSAHAGSDAGSLQDRGVVCLGHYGGKEVLGIRMNWDKRYITLAPVATVLGIAFKLEDPDHLLGDKKDLGITLCLIPTTTPGVEIGQRHFPLSAAFMNGPIRGRDVFVPIDWIIGGREMAGHGWRMLMECLSQGRGISLPALSTASCALAYRMTGAYSRLREQFRLPIGYFEGVQEALSEIGGFTYILEATRQVTASSIDIGVKPAIVSAIAKYHMTELSRKAVNHAMDVHGGKAIMSGPNNYLTCLYQAQPVSITVEGANILTRSLMIFGQGAIRCHPFVRDEMEAATLYETDQVAALKAFDTALFGHLRYAFSNFVKAVWGGLTLGYVFMPPKRDVMSRSFQKLSWMSATLAFTSDIAMMVMGGKLKKAERLSARLGDVLSNLYLGSCVLKYYYENGALKQDENHVRWALDYVLSECQKAFDDFYANFPVRSVAWALRLFMFPFGSRLHYPKDALGSKVAKEMMEDTPLRDRLTALVYTPENAQAPIAPIESAFKKYFEVKHLFDKLHEATHSGLLAKDLSGLERLNAAEAKGILSQDEKKELIEFEKLRAYVIAVDEFSPNYFAGKNAWKTKNITLKAERSTS